MRVIWCFVWFYALIILHNARYITTTMMMIMMGWVVWKTEIERLKLKLILNLRAYSINNSLSLIKCCFERQIWLTFLFFVCQINNILDGNPQGLDCWCCNLGESELCHGMNRGNKQKAINKKNNIDIFYVGYPYIKSYKSDNDFI